MSVVEMARGVAPFYRVGEAIGRGGWLAVVGIQYRPFRRVKRGRRVDGRRRLDGGNEEGEAPVRFSYSRAKDSDRRLCTARRRRSGRWWLG
jgi:hypothetical protein